MNRGDVVLVDWQFTDGAGSKLRPAVVVQADCLNGVLDDTALVQVTSRGHGIPGTEVVIDPATEPRSGLLHLSYAFCPNILTVEQTDVDQVIGQLTPGVMARIESCMRSTLGIP